MSFRLATSIFTNFCAICIELTQQKLYGQYTIICIKTLIFVTIL